MHIDVLDLLGALAGGFLGAALGPLIAFVFTGVAVIAGVAALVTTGDSALLDGFAFGPFFGPHVAFAGGVAAAAYARRRGWLASGRDIVTPLMGLGRPSVLLVGAGFGGLGLLVQQGVLALPWLGTHTDAVALGVVVSAVVARLVFGRSGILGTPEPGRRGLAARFTPGGEHVWLPYQQKSGTVALLGLFVGALSAWSAVTLLAAYPDAPGVVFLGFGVSALSLAALAVNLDVPVTHHITLVSAVAVSAFAAHLTSDVAVVLVGAVVGALTALVGEFFSRLWLIHGDTHIDPPASAIWPMTTLVLAIAAAL